MSELPGSTSPTPDRQVLVVGGGIGGLATAAFLRHNGLSPVVVTGRNGVSETDRDVVLWNSTVVLLDELDVAADLVASTPSIRRWLVRRDAGEVERLTNTHDGQWPCVAVGRAHLCELLRSRLPADSVRLSKTPSRLEGADDGLSVEFDDGVREQFDVVVGADGVPSWVRGARFDTEPPAAWGTTSWDVRAGGRLGAPETVTELWTAGGLVVSGPPGTTGRLRFVTTALPREDPDPDAAADLLSRTVPPEAFAGDGVAPSALSVVDGRADYGVRSDRWIAGRVALVGDAARSFPPPLPLDPSLAVEDAYVLADELATAETSFTALERYAHRRRGRRRALERHVPLADATPRGRLDADGLAGLRDRRAALVRSLFAGRVPAMSADVANRL
jgi:2-polyprenyl-6-methoxyphenol hydroxylase-like FAD-dependent oxidoreductase